jgi:hypothetical protein
MKQEITWQGQSFPVSLALGIMGDKHRICDESEEGAINIYVRKKDIN